MMVRPAVWGIKADEHRAWVEHQQSQEVGDGKWLIQGTKSQLPTLWNTSDDHVVLTGLVWRLPVNAQRQSGVSLKNGIIEVSRLFQPHAVVRLNGDAQHEMGSLLLIAPRMLRLPSEPSMLENFLKEVENAIQDAQEIADRVLDDPSAATALDKAAASTMKDAGVLNTESSPVQGGATGKITGSDAGRMTRSLYLSRNLLLEGVPGTGKTYAIKAIEAAWNRAAEEHPTHFRTIRETLTRTMHPATTYEDFIGGLQPQENGKFQRQDGFFVRACTKADKDPGHDFLVILDEFNRCNIPKVMGDLLTVLEPSKRAKRTADGKGFEGGTKVDIHGGRKFTVPENILVLATMNTTDRSVAPLDAALRRRFAFQRVWPKGFDPAHIGDAGSVAAEIWEDGTTDQRFVASVDAWFKLNIKLKDHGNDAMLGHSYLYALRDDLKRELPAAIAPDESAVFVHHWNQHLLPALSETLMRNRLAKGETRSKVIDSIDIQGHSIHDERPSARKDNLHSPILRLVKTTASSTAE
jgi:hypothetical protein